MRVIPLGINGFFPTFGRHTTSFLVTRGAEAILLDAGTGVARLAEPALRDVLLPFRHLHIILSHYHLDHVIGLSYLIGVLPDIDISIYAPARPFVEADPLVSLRTLLQPPFFSLPLENFPRRPQIIPINTDRIAVGDSDVFVRGQRHPGGSIGVRLGDLVFMTDTVVDEGAIDFAKGAQLLLHEVWLRDEDLAKSSHELDGHSFASGVADLASKSGVRKLMPIHLHPHRNPQEVMSLAAGMKREGLQVILPVEGQTYDLI